MSTTAPLPLSPASLPTRFDTPERRALLLAAAGAWLGTPFFANSEAAGADGGVDCVHLLHGIYRACGVIEPLSWPRQVMDHGQHSDRSLLIEAFDTWPALTARFGCVWRRTNEPEAATLAELRAALLPGDALCFRAGRAPHHGGIVTAPGEFVHVLHRTGVHTMRLDAVIRGWRVLGQLAAVYRPLP